jgi:hypothetical protein
MENKELIFEEVKDRLKEQIIAVEQMTTKFNIILGFNSVLAVFLIQSFINNVYLFYLTKIALIFIIISIFIDFSGLVVKKYRRDPDPWNLFKKYSEKKVEETRDVLIQNFIDSYEYNVKALHRLNKIYTVSIIITLLAVGLIIVNFLKGDVLFLWQKMMNLKM